MITKFARLEFELFKKPSKSRPRHSAWKNNRDSLIFRGLRENWTLALRFRVSGVSSEKARTSLKPDT